MEIQVIREHLDIVKLQEKVNSIVFDNIDTSDNYRKAMRDLNQIYTQVTTFYKDFIDGHDGEIPPANTYWYLFIDCSAKLCYFLATATYYASNELQKTPEKVEKLLEAAARTLPNIEQEENEEFLTAILSLHAEISDDEIKTTLLREEVLKQKGTVKQCLQYFKQFVYLEID
ncbi:hypothetical protein ACIQZG_00800 [Lysinibacillus sp. NPDC096418]|uniref:hypothetical protein n=1 Tax=Lysinibacillus sp. NPDC096418 TaxID=3364138 RepID=UPI0038060B4D